VRRFAVTLNPDMPATHTGIPPELHRRRRTPVLPVIPAGQSVAYAGSVGSYTGARSSEPEPAAAPGTEADGCCG